MNYYNPYFIYPAMTPARTGLLSSLFSGRNFSLSSIMSGTQKTLNLVNQAIPVIKQVSPVVRNAKTMFKVMNEFKKPDTPATNKTDKKDIINENVTVQETNKIEEDSGPTFFM